MSASKRPWRNSARRTAWSQRGGVEQLEVRTLMSASPIGGVGNNVAKPTWGTAGVDLLRKAAAQYADGVSTPAGANRPSARVISNALADQQGEDILSDRQMSAMIYAWGQFIDHDFDLTNTNGTETLSIAVPQGDPWFDPQGTGTQTIDTTRSAFNTNTGTSAANPRQQINSITAFIDGSMVYGSDLATTNSLRTFVGGKMKMGPNGLLPNDPNSPANNPTGTMFLAGDVRVNENVELIAMQTLFVREHNYWANKFASENPRLNDEQLFQKAREQVIFEIQAITYNEWLPTLLGPNALPRYAGYKANVNPGIANEFSTAAFRFGHSLLGDDVEFLDNNGDETRAGVSLAEAFFNPDLVRETGIDPILKYLASDPSSEVDTKVVDSVRNFLFGPPGAGGLDLASLNIARGRDHGLADYNTVRKAYGLPKVTSFAQITKDVEVQNQLQELYGSVDNIDLWVGGLAEDHAPGGSVGQTFKTIIADQFARLRAGDRFWYQNQLKGSALAAMERTSLSDIIRRNTASTNLQQNVFFFRAEIAGRVMGAPPQGQTRDVATSGMPRGGSNGGQGPTSRPPQPLPNETVQLVDAESGDVVATTTTNARGEYRFTIFDGLRTGDYVVRHVKQDGTPGLASMPIAITRGEQFVRGVDLVLASANGHRPKPHHGQVAGTDTVSVADATVNGAATGTLLAASSADGQQTNGATANETPQTSSDSAPPASPARRTFAEIWGTVGANADLDQRNRAATDLPGSVGSMAMTPYVVRLLNGLG